VLGLSVQPTISTSTDVERVKAIVDSLVRKGVAYAVGLHAYLCNPFWPNIDDTLKPAFGEAVAKDVSSEVYNAFKGIDIYAKVKVEGVEVELRDYLRRYILGERISKMILEEVEKRFNQMPEGEKRVLSVACAIINAVKGRDYPAFSVGESKGYLSVYSLDGEYFSKVVSSVLGFEVHDVRSLFYKYLLGFQCDGSSRRHVRFKLKIYHVWSNLKVYPFVEAYIKKLASEAQRYIRIFNRREVEEKLNELYRNGDLLRLSVIHEMVYSRPTRESLNFLSYFTGVEYEDLCKWAKVEGIISDCFVNPLVYDYVKDVMKILHDKALSELVEPFRKVFEREGYESICVNECCTFTKALSKPIYMCFSPWPKEISAYSIPEGAKVVVVRGEPAQSILKYLQDRRREELWVFVEGDRIFIALNTYKAEAHQEVVRVLGEVKPPPPPPVVPPSPSKRVENLIRARPSREVLEGIVASVLEDLGFRVSTNVRLEARRGSPIEVDIWAQRVIGRTRFSIYVSCKNWNRAVDRSVIDEEAGRVMNLRDIPQLKVLIAKELTEPAREAAEADGFMVIELGRKADAENSREIYEIVYKAFNELLQQ
jgi:hypothetical protein